MSVFQDLLADHNSTIAVVGATDDPFKFGGKIYRDLKRKGYRVFPVNPTRQTVDGDPAYATLADLPDAPDIIDVVVPAEVGISIAEQANDLGYRRIWYQPGSESSTIIDYLEKNEFDYLAGPCIMVHSKAAPTF